MPQTFIEWVLVLALVGLWARIAFVLALIAGPRHARYRLRVKVARWLMAGQLREARAGKRGKLVVPMSVRAAQRGRTAQRRKVLSVVRRDDSSADTA